MKTKFVSIGLVAIFSLLFLASTAQAVVRITLQGSASDNNVVLQKQSSRSISGSIGMDLGTYFRVGVTRREAVSSQNGYSLVEGTESEYVFSESIQNVSANSLDFTLVLYYGQIFMPYVQAGMVLKTYVFETRDPNVGWVRSTAEAPPMPNAGVGINLKINRHFSLKISHTGSPGFVQEDPSAEIVQAWDTYTSAGISYSL